MGFLQDCDLYSSHMICQPSGYHSVEISSHKIWFYADKQEPYDGTAYCHFDLATTYHIYLSYTHITVNDSFVWLQK